MALLNTATKVYTGGTPAVSVYKGSVKVWPSTPALSAYAAAVIADTPLRYWQFEEASGGYVTTYGTSTATVIGSPARPTSGAVTGSTRSVGFPTTSDYVQLDTTGNLPGSANRSAFTVECWFKVPTLTDIPAGQIDYQIMGTDSTSGIFNDMSWHVLMERSGAYIGVVAMSVCIGGARYLAYAMTRYDNNVWHHVVGTYAGGSLKIYYDGALGNTAATSGGAVNGGIYPAVIGQNYYFSGGYPANVFPGSVDEVAIYAGALPSARVLAHYQARDEREAA
jgi:hypothetical protein